MVSGTGEPCWHCGEPFPDRGEPVPLFGKSVVCPACARPFHLLRADERYRSIFSEDLLPYFLYRKRNQQVEHLERDIGRLQRYEETLRSQNRGLHQADQESLKRFAEVHLPAGEIDEFSAMVSELCDILVLGQVIAENPLSGDSPFPPLAPPAPSTEPPAPDTVDEATAYEAHRRASGQLDGLEEEMGWIRALEKRVQARGKTLTTVTMREISAFVDENADDLEAFLEPLNGFYDHLQSTGAVSENPLNELLSALLHGDSSLRQSMLGRRRQRKRGNGNNTAGARGAPKKVEPKGERRQPVAEIVPLAPEPPPPRLETRSRRGRRREPILEAEPVAGEERNRSTGRPHPLPQPAFEPERGLIEAGNRIAGRSHSGPPREPGPAVSNGETGRAAQSPSRRLPMPSRQPPGYSSSRYGPPPSISVYDRRSRRLWQLIAGVAALAFIGFLVLGTDLLEGWDGFDDSSGKTAMRSKKQSEPIITPIGEMRRKLFFDYGRTAFYRSRNLPTDATSSTKLNPLARTWDVLDRGRTLFSDYCAQCHGLNGSGGSGANLRMAGDGILHKDAFLYWTIAQGGDPTGSDMPPFKSLLSPEQIWSLVLFLDTLS